MTEDDGGTTGEGLSPHDLDVWIDDPPWKRVILSEVFWDWFSVFRI